MAGKELKATEKTVLKHSRDGVLEQNLVDGSAKKVSSKAEEVVLKTARPDDERFDKLKAAGLVVEDVKKPDHRKLQFGRNNPENTWAEAVYGNKLADDKDLNWLKQITGNENLSARKSNVAYIPPQKNIIGNTEYRYIPDKQYVSADSDTALKMAEIMLSRNIKGISKNPF